jgi:hypothetical protein
MGTQQDTLVSLLIELIGLYGLDGAVIASLAYSIKLSLDNRQMLRYLEGKLNGGRKGP